MHMFYEIVLTMQLVHLNCRKGHEQPPTRKEALEEISTQNGPPKMN